MFLKYNLHDKSTLGFATIMPIKNVSETVLKTFYQKDKKVVVVANDVIDIRERIERIREAVQSNPVGQTGTDTIIPVSSTIELDSIGSEKHRQLKTAVNTQMLQPSKAGNDAIAAPVTSENQQSNYPSIKLDISNQSRNLGLSLMLAFQGVSNIIMIILLYRLGL